MAKVTDIAIVDDDRMLIDGLRAWARDCEDLRLTGAAATVSDLLAILASPPDVVLLDLVLQDHSDPAANVQRLVQASHRVLVISAWAGPRLVATVFEAGAQGYITKDQQLGALHDAIQRTAADEVVCSQELASALLTEGPRRPQLSAREREILLAYASGMTLEIAARHIGIKPATAKTYLLRVKTKYQELGRPALTKLDLAERVREDYPSDVTRPHPQPQPCRSADSGIKLGPG